jgi:hypothetical protein
MQKKDGKAISDGTITVLKEVKNGKIMWKLGNMKM